jgi:hydroxyethylthiazole kinase-like uncharacterized protein yjeF
MAPRLACSLGGVIPILSRAQVREYDTHAIEERRVPGIVLMENAGRGAAEAILARIHAAPGGAKGARVAIVAGTGNNGGDGFVVARHLAARGVEASVVVIGRADRIAGDARPNHDAWVELGGACTVLPAGTDRSMIEAEIADATLIVDALFGTGLDRAIEGTFADAVAAMNDARAPVVALDLPSGLDADTGVVLGVAVEAVATITFAHRKLGLCTPRGAERAGEVTVAGLGLPDARVLEAVGVAAWGLEAADVAAWLQPRRAGAHKHAAGDVLLVAGGAGTSGAALLAAMGALRAGAGLATIATFPEARATLDSRVVEVMTRAIDPDDVEGSLDTLLARRSAVVVGPGFGAGDVARRAIEHVVSTFEGLVVMDADAITCFGGRPEDLAAAPGDLVLTPHPGELGRLLGRPSAEIEVDRFASAQEAAARTRSVVVLKGAHTLIAAPDGTTWVAMDRAPALATAGSGDVLAGMVAGLAGALDDAAGPETQRAMRCAAAAVVAHARAGVRWSERLGGADRGLLASEIAALVPEVLAHLARRG